jgi:hypothetical protein
MNTTLFDLNQSAATAAVTALGKDALATESLKLEAFTASAFDRADFSQWQAYFTNHVANYTSLKAQPSPATKAAEIYTPDGRLYTFPHAAITKHPDINLGANKALFGSMQITNILAAGITLGAAGAFHSVTESGATDPGGAFITSDVERGAWYGAWGTSTGFGGDGGAALEAEDGWTISTAVKYSPLAVQKLVRAYKLDEVYFMCKGRPYGPTHTEITAMTGINAGRGLGQFIPTTNAADLVLTGPNSKTVTLKNADIVGAGFDFGGTKLGSDEIGFVTGMTFTAGAPQPLLEFST